MNTYTKEILYDLLVTKGNSCKDVGIMFEVNASSIRKAAKRRGIDLSRQKKTRLCRYCGNNISHTKNNVYCGVDCSKKHLSKMIYDKFIESPEENQRGNFNVSVIKRFILEEQGNKCAICGIDSYWNDKPLIFVLDHIDGNAANNTRENFRCICPNCDSQLDTYKSKNKNSARTYRSKYYKN